MVMDANLLPPLISILQVAEFRTRKEAAWAITNATSGGSAEQIRYDRSLLNPGLNRSFVIRSATKMAIYYNALIFSLGILLSLVASSPYVTS